jgi:hypothetical protein
VQWYHHEIISLDPKATKDIAIKEQIEILTDIGNNYLQQRAKNNLSY